MWTVTWRRLWRADDTGGKTHHPGNERLKRAYFTYLSEARRYSEASLDQVAKALHRFESYTRFRDFRSFHTQQAIGFKRHLAEQASARTGEKLGKATLYSTLTALRNFFRWLAGQPGFRSRLSYSDADYFSLSEKETHRQGRARAAGAVARARASNSLWP